jgi:carboxyl-terminal processing protease
MKVRSIINFACVIIVSALFFACGHDDNEKIDPKIIKVNKFITEGMEFYYLWSDQMPEINYKYEKDSKAYFEKLLFSEDKWSFITDDVEALENSLEGIEKSFGYSLAFGRFSNTETYFALVEYVYPNTPAAEAGIKRGDIIVDINGASITVDNYQKLFNADQIKLSMGVYDGQSIRLSGETKSMTSRELHLDPVMQYSVIETNGHRVGYLLYQQYIDSYKTSVDAALQFFQSQQITDLVVDIRYNPGGAVTAAQYLCSSIAPKSVVDAKELLVTYQFNNYITSDFEKNNAIEQTRVRFNNKATVNLDMNKVYFLTGSGSASASELTITGLRPYMNVVLIGDTTYGKYTGSFTLKAVDLYEKASDYAEIENWGMQPIVLRYANALGETDFKKGFAPNYYVKDDLFAGVPLGDKQEPLLNRALQLITGSEIIAMKSAKTPMSEFRIIDRGFSKFDRNKRNLQVEMPIIQK